MRLQVNIVKENVKLYINFCTVVSNNRKQNYNNNEHNENINEDIATK